MLRRRKVRRARAKNVGSLQQSTGTNAISTDSDDGQGDEISLRIDSGSVETRKSEIHIKMSEVAGLLSGSLNAMRVLFSVAEDRFAAAPRELVFGRPAQAALGVEHYMCVASEAVMLGMVEGTAAIVREVSAGGTDDDRECLDYILHAEAGSSDRTYQGGLRRDCDERGGVLACRTATDGSGVVRGMRLADFIAHPSARHANLTEAHVVALRLYTTQALPLQSCVSHLHTPTLSVRP